MNEELLADLLDGVEQQLSSPATPYVARTLARLVKLGIDEQEAKIEIAICLGDQLDEVLRTRQAFNETAYRVALDLLPGD